MYSSKGMFQACFRRGALSTLLLLLVLAFFGGNRVLAASASSPDGEKAVPSVVTGDAAVQAGQDAGISRFWMSRTDDLANLLGVAQELQAKAEQLAPPLSDKVQNARAQFARLKGLFQASRGHPTEQLTLVQQMHSTLEVLQSGTKPLWDIVATINERLQEVEALQKDLANYYGEVDSARSGEDDGQGLHAYAQTLSKAGKTLKAASRRLDTIIAPAKLMQDRVSQEIKEIDDSMVGIWKDYYLAASTNTLDALASAPQILADWLTSFSSRMAFAYPQTGDEWGGAVKNFIMAALATLFLGVVGLRGAAKLPEPWREACENVIKKAWVFIALGLSVLAASTNHYGGIYFAFVLFGGLIVIWGIASMSWRLRIVVRPSLKGKSSPLAFLFIPSATGVFMLFSDLPTRILGILWGVFLITFIIAAIFVHRKEKSQEAQALPLLESITNSCILWFGIASLFVTFFGQARLAILVFMALFAFVNIITLATCLMGLLELLSDRLFGKESQPVRNALAQATAVPVAWLLSLICTLPWIWALPGARYLIQQVMVANYQVGEAHFDFSRLFVILLLFFLFRSFVSLGRTSLEHLPDRLPNIERGVIPPLGNLVSYGLWALFGIISLGMLGVNFTSLAVVAGGLSVGIGFGMQNIFNNLISGMMLIFGRTLLVGDFVDVGNVSGTVRAINIRSTTLETAERALIYVPNSALMSGQFTNWTRNSRMVRRSISIGVAYGSNTARVIEILLETAKQNGCVLMYPAPAAYFTNFGDNALEFTLNVFIDNLDNAVPALSDLRLEIARRFDEEGIDIPYPQLTLHMPGNAQAGSGISPVGAVSK